MNKERYNQIVDEVYKHYKRITHYENEKNGNWGSGDTPLIAGVQHLTKLSFIQMCKIDSDFSEKWGLKIEERDLSFKERRDLAHEYAVSHNKLPLCIDAYGHEGIPKYHEVINKTGWNIPTKLITITHKNEIIEVYE